MALNRKTIFSTCAALVAACGSVAAFPVIADQASDQRSRMELRLQAQEFVDSQGQADIENDLAGRLAATYLDNVGEDASLIDQVRLELAIPVATDVRREAQNRAAERQCLAEAVYYEARSEPYVGQKAVAEVVLNRVRHRAYPDTICGVVYEGSERVTGCQFSFTCDGSKEIAPRGTSWDRSQAIADHALLGFAKPLTDWATHYHTVAVDPHWSGTLHRIKRIGTHIFYKFKSRRMTVTPATDA